MIMPFKSKTCKSWVVFMILFLNLAAAEKSRCRDLSGKNGGGHCSKKKPSRRSAKSINDIFSKGNIEVAKQWLAENGGMLSNLKDKFFSREQDVPEPSLKNMYPKIHVTNEVDFKIREKLDGLEQIIHADPAKAAQGFKDLMRANLKSDKKAQSPRARFGLARCYKTLAQKDQSVGKKEEALNYEDLAMHSFCRVLQMRNVPRLLLMQSGTECLELSKHKNQNSIRLAALKVMSRVFPDNHTYRQFSKAEESLNLLLDDNHWKDPLAKTMLGLAIMLKAGKKDSSSEEDHIQTLLNEGAQELDSVKIYGMLATVLRRAGEAGEAERVYDAGLQNGLFLSKWQRSASNSKFNFRNLTGRPVWPLELTGHSEALGIIQSHWKQIRDEGLAALAKSATRSPSSSSSLFSEESENLREEGMWKQLVLFENGRKMEAGCAEAKRTCEIVETHFPSATYGMSRGQVKFSALYPGTHVWPHTGPTNTRLRAHLGLQVPAEPREDKGEGARKEGKIRLRIADQFLSWEEGNVFVIDDSFEHEVWHNGSSGIRLVLLIDMWHPELTQEDRKKLTPLPNSFEASEVENADPVIDVAHFV